MRHVFAAVVGVSSLLSAFALANGSMSHEENTNRGGGDYDNFSLGPEGTSFECSDRCRAEERCRAFTYVKPKIQGEYARCWLKDSVPDPVFDPNCTSGMKQ